jgi:hypothetical protein
VDFVWTFAVQQQYKLPWVFNALLCSEHLACESSGHDIGGDKISFSSANRGGYAQPGWCIGRDSSRSTPTKSGFACRNLVWQLVQFNLENIWPKVKELDMNVEGSQASREEGEYATLQIRGVIRSDVLSASYYSKSTLAQTTERKRPGDSKWRIESAMIPPALRASGKFRAELRGENPSLNLLEGSPKNTR